LSNPGASWSAPYKDKDGNVKGKPTRQADNQPARVVTKLEQVSVLYPKEVQRFHVAVRVGSQGLMLKCTDGSSRRIRAAVERWSRQEGKGAWYVFDHSMQEAVILVPDRIVPLENWVEEEAGRHLVEQFEKREQEEEKKGE
jgi:hypothetical protein